MRVVLYEGYRVNTYNREVACSMGFLIWQIEWCNHHLHHVTGSGHAELKARIRGLHALDSKEILLMLSFVYCR